jgi:hypothetical protein
VSGVGERMVSSGGRVSRVTLALAAPWRPPRSLAVTVNEFAPSESGNEQLNRSALSATEGHTTTVVGSRSRKAPVTRRGVVAT